MPRRNWRPPSGLSDHQSPVAVVDDDDQEPAESPVAAQRVWLMPNGKVAHLPSADIPRVMLCGRITVWASIPIPARPDMRLCKDCEAIANSLGIPLD